MPTGEQLPAARVQYSSIKLPYEDSNAHDYSTREVAGVTIVDISGRIVLGDESAALRDLVRHLLSMEQEDSIQSCQCQSHRQRGFGPSDRRFHERAETGGRKLLNLTNKVHDLIQATRLYTVLGLAVQL